MRGRGWFFAFFAQFSIGFIRIRLLFSWFHTTLHWGPKHNMCIYLNTIFMHSDWLTDWVYLIHCDPFIHVYTKVCVCGIYRVQFTYLASFDQGRKKRAHCSCHLNKMCHCNRKFHMLKWSWIQQDYGGCLYVCSFANWCVIEESKALNYGRAKTKTPMLVIYKYIDLIHSYNGSDSIPVYQFRRIFFGLFTEIEREKKDNR